ncbi:hypothetical protein ScPMuIL_003209 [Solemya velum]
MDSSDSEEGILISNIDDIKPYQFEPPRRDKVEEGASVQLESEDSEFSDSENNQYHADGMRTDNLAWCDCDKCPIMATNDECLCCREVGPIDEKLDEANLPCITKHERFLGNCLNRHVIEVSLYEYVEYDGPIDDNEPINELYRHIAYRRFTRWIWHRLGKGRRKVIPSCAVTKIREAFPSEEYTGFKYARP